MTRRAPADDLSLVIESIYAAALDPSAWPAAIERSAPFVGATNAIMLLWNDSSLESGVVVAHRVDAEGLDRWQQEYLGDDVWSHAGATRFAGRPFVTTGASLVHPTEFAKMRICNDLLRPRGMLDLLATSLRWDGPVMSALSFYRREIFQRRHVERLAALAPHLRLAAAVQRQLVETRGRAVVAESALDALGVGVLVLDGSGHVARANRKAEAILRSQDGLRIHHRRLCCAAGDETRALEGAITRAAQASERRVTAAGQALRVLRPSRRRSLGLIVSPIVPAEIGPSLLTGVAWRAGAGVLVTVSDPEDGDVPASEHLRRLFGLTPAESRLAAALAGGQSLAEYAEQSTVSIGTVRWTVKRILEKTGCRRQGDLVRLLLKSAAGFIRP